ncbi:hypothetical protein [Streptomyces rimosus]
MFSPHLSPFPAALRRVVSAPVRPLPFATLTDSNDNPHRAGPPDLVDESDLPLARLELRVMFEELPRLSDIRRTAEPRYVRSNFVGGLKELAVEVTLA